MPLATSNEHLDKLTFSLIDDHILRHTIQFFYKTIDDILPFGSGVLAYIHGNHFILTASHIVSHMLANELFIRVSETEFYNVTGIAVGTDIMNTGGIDVGYIKIDNRTLGDIREPYKFLPTNKISKHELVANASNYCVVGFPERNIRSTETSSYETGAASYLVSGLTNKNAYAHYKLNQKNYFLLSMNGKGTDLINGGKTKVDSRLEGMSCCGVWYIKINEGLNAHEYMIDYSLIGIATDYRKGKYFALLMRELVRKESYFSFTKEGSNEFGISSQLS